VFIILKESKRKGMDENRVMDLIIYTLIAAFIGARVYYIIAFDLAYYMEHPLRIFAVRNGGLSIQGGLIFGIAFAAIYSKILKINFWKAADAFAPGIIIGQAIGRFGCDVFGIPMKGNYSWGVTVGSALLHPVQIYEAFLNIGLFIVLWKFRDKTKYHGQLFISYIIGFSLIRSAVEFFRINPIIWGPFTVVHLTSLILIGIALVIRFRIKDKYPMNETPYLNEGLLNDPVIYLLTVVIAISGTWIYYAMH
jgi:phosphatidylglycerol:prolipoprotein diacylglycerol transferase